MNCVVTGAAGFIGSALVERLIAEGHNVRAFIHKKTPTSLDCKVRYIAVDLTDPSSLPTAMQDVDVVFHCAAVVKEYGSRQTFLEVNVKGTQHLVDACGSGLKRFIFLSHLHSDIGKTYGWYSYSKGLAEQYLLQKHRENGFPVVIIRPGNVIGPGEAAWVLRPLHAIQTERIALIDRGSGIFLHTYIDNLLDALVTAMQAPGVIGETIEITDGDNETTWGEYLNALAIIAGKTPITKKISKPAALALSYLTMLPSYLGQEPLVTPAAVHFFTNKRTVSLDKAERLLGYTPRVAYKEGMKRIHTWLKTQHYI